MVDSDRGGDESFLFGPLSQVPSKQQLDGLIGKEICVYQPSRDAKKPTEVGVFSSSSTLQSWHHIGVTMVHSHVFSILIVQYNELGAIPKQIQPPSIAGSHEGEQQAAVIRYHQNGLPGITFGVRKVSNTLQMAIWKK